MQEVWKQKMERKKLERNCFDLFLWGEDAELKDYEERLA